MRDVPAEQPTVLHVSHRKAGSQWAYQVLAAAAPGRVIRALPRSDHFFCQPVIPGMVYPTIFGSRERVEAVAIEGPQRRVFVMRDLRDTLVSLYFGIRHSHPHLNDPELAARIAVVRGLPPEEGMRHEMHFPLRDVAATQVSWMGSGVPIVRYEELVADEVEGFGRLLGHCGISVSERQLRGLLAPASFEARAGRPPGTEDVASHNRKGIVGDWRNHLRGELLAEFKELYDDVLVETGYETGRDWGASPSATTEGLRRRRRLWRRGPRCWCGSARLRAHAPGFDRCGRCGSLVATGDPAAREPLDSDRVWTDVRFHHLISQPARAWRGAPPDRRRDAWTAATIERLDLLRQWLPGGGRVLDAAAGSGALAAMLRDAGYAVTAVEPSAAAAAQARDAWELDVSSGDPLAQSGPFDAVVAVDVLQRLADPVAFLRGCAVRLGPDGVVLVDQPLADGQPDRDLLRPAEYAYVFTPESLDRLIAAAGLAVVHRAGTLRIASARRDGVPRGARPTSGLLTAALGQRAEAEMLAAALADERRLVAEQQREHLESHAPRLVDDRLGFGAGWHELEHGPEGAFRWAGEDAEITIGHPSGRRSALVLEVEPGPGVGGRDYALELLGADGVALDRVPGPRRRQEVRLDCPVAAGEAAAVRLRASPGGLPTPGEDARILNFRVFRVGWA